MIRVISYLPIKADFDPSAFEQAAGFTVGGLAALITGLSFASLFLIGAIALLIGGMSAIMAGAKIRTVIGIVVVTFILLALFTTIFSIY